MHWNLGREYMLNASTVLASLEKLKRESLRGKEVLSKGSARVHLPSQGNLCLNEQEQQSGLFRVHSFSSFLIISFSLCYPTLEPLPSFGSSLDTNLSRSISLTWMDDEGNEIPLQTDLAHPFEILHWSFLQCFSTMRPVNENFICRFDRAPILNISQAQINGWMVFSPKSNKHTHVALPLSSLLFSFQICRLKVFPVISWTTNKRRIIDRWSLLCDNWTSLRAILRWPMKTWSSPQITNFVSTLRRVSISMRRRKDENLMESKWDRRPKISKINAFLHI